MDRLFVPLRCAKEQLDAARRRANDLTEWIRMQDTRVAELSEEAAARGATASTLEALRAVGVETATGPGITV